MKLVSDNLAKALACCPKGCNGDAVVELCTLTGCGGTPSSEACEACCAASAFGPQCLIECCGVEPLGSQDPPPPAQGGSGPSGDPSDQLPRGYKDECADCWEQKAQAHAHCQEECIEDHLPGSKEFTACAKGCTDAYNMGKVFCYHDAGCGPPPPQPLQGLYLYCAVCDGEYNCCGCTPDVNPSKTHSDKCAAKGQQAYDACKAKYGNDPTVEAHCTTCRQQRIAKCLRDYIDPSTGEPYACTCGVI